MRRTTVLAIIAAFALSGLATGADAAKQCRDAKGKFTKCPPAAAAPEHCKDPKTKKFTKCSAPGAVPA